MNTYSVFLYMEKSVVDTLVKWTSYKSEEEKDTLINKFKNEISTKLNFSLIGPDGYSIFFTDSDNTSNSTIITSTIRSFIKLTSKKPHIITSSMEQNETISLLKDMEEECIDITILNEISIETVLKAIRPNTCLISIIWYSPQLAIKNNIKEIGELARKNKIPFHTDATYIFNRILVKPFENNITSFTASFDKKNGLSSILVIQNNFLEGYKLKPIIYKNENNGIHNIAASRETFKIIFREREWKNNTIYMLKKKFIKRLRYIKSITLLLDKKAEEDKIIYNIPIKYNSRIDSLKKLIPMINTKRVLFCTDNDHIFNIEIDDYTYNEDLEPLFHFLNLLFSNSCISS